MNTNMYAAMAYANGDTVKRGHDDYCRNHSHAVWVVNGKDKGVCPRCGCVTATHIDADDLAEIIRDYPDDIYIDTK